ncbi:MAG: tRNA lysidine(34) synthetase TilS [Nitrospirae bacterium]|nr:tRNA lysidine(34) synthetase TilS [Nitrospirota bacterium]
MSNENALIKKVRETIKHFKMLEYGDNVLVAVSSGPDSVCLLHVLKELQDENNLSLNIAHLNHGFRGEEAEDDARFVQDMGDSLGIPVIAEYSDIPAYARAERISKQEAAREVRYRFLSSASDKTGADRIALGHTADDQAETFLMRLLRGSGSHGLSGIPPVRGMIIRPLIGVLRKEISEYLSSYNIRCRIDSSNLSPVYLRNKIRLELIPYLAKEYNPNIMNTIIRSLNVLRDEDIFLENYVKTMFRDVVKNQADGIIQFDVKRFNACEKPVKRRLVRCAVEFLKGSEGIALSFQHVEEALSLLYHNRSGEINLPAGVVAERRGDLFSIYLQSSVISTPQYALTVRIPGDTIVHEAGIKINTTIRSSLFPKRGTQDKAETGRDTAYFDINKFTEPLIVRNRREGDFFCPQGMGGKRKKIKEYFIDLKISRKDKERIPILTSPEGIMWVAGYRMDERFGVTQATEKVLEVRAEKIAA